MKTVKIFSILLIVISLAVSFWALPKMPDRIASHWGIDGLANGYSSKNFGLFLMPVVSVFMLLLFWFIFYDAVSFGSARFNDSVESWL